MEALVSWLYVACVNFMVNGANLLGMTYRDLNVILLVLAMPALTLLCLVACLLPWRSPPPPPRPGGGSPRGARDTLG